MPSHRSLAARAAVLSALVLLALSASATTFIVPDDAELVEKADAIVTGVVLTARAVKTESGDIETEYEIGVDRVLKGAIAPRSRLRISSPGGAVDGEFMVVHSAAHFVIDDEVLLFLTRHRGGWTPTDMTLGKFRFQQTSRGHSVLVRDEEDIVGWDRDGKVHREKIRLEAEFLQFIEETVAGREPERTYEVEANEVLAPPVAQPERAIVPHAAFPATTYSVSFTFCDLTRAAGRWATPVMTAGRNYFKNAAQNASGLADGGESIIQNALAAWTTDCGSAVNINYGGTSPNLRDGFDGVNVVVFNDPGGHIGGSWTGSGVIATAFSRAGGSETFDGSTFLNFTDGDVVFQDGFPGTHPSIEEAMTHEIGHTIGLRHADRHHLRSCTSSSPTNPCTITCNPESACQSNVEECASSAIMTASVTSGLNFTLQTWDRSAANALYPTTCVTFTPPTNVVATANGTAVTVTWDAVTGATQYRVFRRASTAASFGSHIGTSSTATFTDSTALANTSYQYVVQAGDGTSFSANSNSDFATTVTYTDPTLAAGTAVKTAHFTDLLTAVNALRTLVGQAAISFTAPEPLVGNAGLAAHMGDLRTGLTAARTALGLSTSFGETIVAGSTTYKVSHINELRDGVK